MDPLIDTIVDLLALQGCRVAVLPNQGLQRPCWLSEPKHNRLSPNRLQSDEDDCRRGATRMQLVCLQETVAANVLSSARDAARGRSRQVGPPFSSCKHPRPDASFTLFEGAAWPAPPAPKVSEIPAASLAPSGDMPCRQQLRSGESVMMSSISLPGGCWLLTETSMCSAVAADTARCRRPPLVRLPLSVQFSPSAAYKESQGHRAAEMAGCSPCSKHVF
jgi:hypothetical protein